MALKILASKTVSGNTPKTRHLIEKAGQTFVSGVPVMKDAADGGIKEWTGTVATDLIAGFSAADAQNLASTGLNAPQPLQPYGGLGSSLTFGSVQNQPNAKNIARGGPVQDGRVPFFTANDDTVFEGAVGAAQTTVATDVGVDYGLTKDADGQWYVDRTKTGANACVTIQALHPLDGPKLAGRVLFVVKASSQGILA